MEFITLSNGVKMPMEGFGVFQVPEAAICEQAVSEALETGGRVIIGTNQRKPSKIKGLRMI